MTASDEASGMPTPRTDALRHGSTFTYPHRARELCYELERELAAMELRAMDCVALNERQAINFAKCQSELQQARTMHAEAIEEWAKWEGAAKQARGEAQWIPVSERLPKESVLCALINFDRTQSNQYSTPVAQCGYLSTLSSSQPYWSIYGERATSIEAFTHWMPLPAAPSPASGEQINAAGQASGQPHFARGQENKPAPAAPNTAPQDVSGTKVNQPAQAVAGLNDAEPVSERPFPAAAVPDDPVAVYERIRYEAGREHTRSKALRALAAHYEAKGMRRAAEQVRILAGRQGLDEDREFVYCIAGQIEEAAKEADRGRR